MLLIKSRLTFDVLGIIGVIGRTLASGRAIATATGRYFIAVAVVRDFPHMSSSKNLLSLTLMRLRPTSVCRSLRYMSTVAWFMNRTGTREITATPVTINPIILLLSPSEQLGKHFRMLIPIKIKTSCRLVDDPSAVQFRLFSPPFVRDGFVVIDFPFRTIFWFSTFSLKAILCILATP